MGDAAEVSRTWVGKKCVCLLRCRAAAIVQVTVADQLSLSATTQAQYGWKLPQEPLMMHVRTSDDPDHPSLSVPSCCVLNAAGIVPAPPGADACDGNSAEAITGTFS